MEKTMVDKRGNAEVRRNRCGESLREEKPWPCSRRSVAQVWQSEMREHDGEKLVESNDVQKSHMDHCGDVAVRKTIRKYDYEEDYENTNEESIVMIVRS